MLTAGDRLLINGGHQGSLGFRLMDYPLGPEAFLKSQICQNKHVPFKATTCHFLAARSCIFKTTTKMTLDDTMNESITM